jgi:hypothetical protein
VREWEERQTEGGGRHWHVPGDRHSINTAPLTDTKPVYCWNWGDTTLRDKTSAASIVFSGLETRYCYHYYYYYYYHYYYYYIIIMIISVSL